MQNDENRNSEQSINKGLSESGKAIGQAKRSKTLKKASKKINDKAKEILLTNKTLLLFLGGFMLIGFLLMLILSSTPPSTMFTSDEPDSGDIKYSLYDGWISTKIDAGEYIVEVIEDKYHCDGDISNLSELAYDNKYVYETDTCEINIDFAPDIEEFAQRIDAYSNAINGTLSLFEGDEKSRAVSVEDKQGYESRFTEFDEDGKAQLSDYAKNRIDQYDNEYVDSQSRDFYSNLHDYAYYIFDYERNTDEWDFKNFRWGKKPKEYYVCFVDEEIKTTDPITKKTTTTTRTVEVSCSSNWDYREKRIKYIDAQFGDITVYMTYDADEFKKNEVNNCIDSLVGRETILQDELSGLSEPTRTILNAEQSERLVKDTINNYYASYLQLYLGGRFVPGSYGSIDYSRTSWDYSRTISPSNTTLSNSFWKHAESLNSILHNLPYAKDNYAVGPAMTHQCTEYAGTFFYDYYGFAALRGNGNNQADFLLKDCGENSGCPVEFARGMGPSPGAIVSLYPNHVIVVFEVNEDGSIVIGEGNVNGGNVNQHETIQGGLEEYERNMGMTVKTIAVPLNDE